MDSLINELIEKFQVPLQSPVLIFSVILFIILITPIVLEKLRIPDIIGLIVAGIIIGPHGFNILEESIFVDIFSTIGLLYIMFLAGLDLNLIEFKANRNKSYLFGLATFVLPFALGFPVCYWVLDFDLYASLLVSSIFATHTLVTYPIVGRFGVSKDPSVAVTVGGTILTDTAVLVVLAMILGAHNGELSAEFWIRLIISIALFSAFMVLLVPRVAGWFFDKLEHQKHSHYIFVLAVVFLAAFLAEVAGLEGIIGAFAAGLALNKLIPNSSALMNRIEFIGNSLFIPFFLISVGMIVDLRVVFDGFTVLLVAGALTVVAFAGKYAAADVTRWAFKLSKNQRDLIFGLSSAHAAATLAVVVVGYRAGIVGNHITNAVIVVILVSCVIASFVTAAAARKIAESTNGDEDVEVKRELDMEQILIPLASSTKFQNLLHFAVLIKEKKSTHPLAVLNVVPNTDEAERQVAMAKKALEEVRAEVVGADVEVNVMATIAQHRADGISRAALEIAANIILMDWPQGKGFVRNLIDNQPQSILYQTNKTLVLCNLGSTSLKHSGIFVVMPEWVEWEPGFAMCMDKLARLSLELSVPIKLNCSKHTQAAVDRFIENSGLTLDIDFREFSDWEDLSFAFRSLADTDLLVVVSARRGGRSHNAYLDRLPRKLEQHFAAFNKILIYP